MLMKNWTQVHRNTICSYKLAHIFHCSLYRDSTYLDFRTVSCRTAQASQIRRRKRSSWSDMGETHVGDSRDSVAWRATDDSMHTHGYLPSSRRFLSDAVIEVQISEKLASQESVWIPDVSIVAIVHESQRYCIPTVHSRAK